MSQKCSSRSHDPTQDSLQDNGPGRTVLDVPLDQHVNHTSFWSQYYQSVDCEGEVLPCDQRMQRMMLELPFDVWPQVGQSTPPGPSPGGWAEPGQEAVPAVQGQGLESQADDSQRSEAAELGEAFLCTLSSQQEYLRELQKKKAAWTALRDEVLAANPILQDERWPVAASMLAGGQGLAASGMAARCAEALQELKVKF